MVGNTESNAEDLRLPHPLAHQRGFVLAPWYEIDAKGELPGRGKLADLLAPMDVHGVVRRDDLVIEGD